MTRCKYQFDDDKASFRAFVLKVSLLLKQQKAGFL